MKDARLCCWWAAPGCRRSASWLRASALVPAAHGCGRDLLDGQRLLLGARPSRRAGKWCRPARCPVDRDAACEVGQVEGLLRRRRHRWCRSAVKRASFSEIGMRLALAEHPAVRARNCRRTCGSRRHRAVPSSYSRVEDVAAAAAGRGREAAGMTVPAGDGARRLTKRPPHNCCVMECASIKSLPPRVRAMCAQRPGAVKPALIEIPIRPIPAGDSPGPGAGARR